MNEICCEIFHLKQESKGIYVFAYTTYGYRIIYSVVGAQSFSVLVSWTIFGVRNVNLVRNRRSWRCSSRDAISNWR